MSGSFLIVILILIILLLLFVVLWQYKIYVQPVKSLKQVAQKLSEGEYIKRTYIQGESEAGEICKLINKIGDKHLSLEQRLKDKSKELERTVRALDNFAYVVSHDLKAPFNSIKSIAELLRLEYGDKFDEGGKELLRFIDIKVNEMDKLLIGILKYSRIRQEEDKVVSVDLNKELLYILEDLNIPKTVEVKIVNTLPVLSIEKDLIQTVFISLIENSVKNMNREQGKILIGSETHGKLHTFFVEDNGVGIDARYFDKIFTIFYLIGGQKDDPNAGSGVGLAIVKKIVEYKGGEIWVESKLGQGSTFSFTLPELGTNIVVN
jgi:light-regulated signal transduction histidine kinase (bacteriophytochrome)